MSVRSKTKAASSFWTDRFDDEPTDDPEDLLRTVVRCANVATNSLGDERTLKVEWAKNPDDRNTAENPTIFLGSEFLDAIDDRGRTVDAMMGEILLQSTMKRTIDRRVEKRMPGRDDREKLENIVWNVLERRHAEEEILGELPGYVTYLEESKKVGVDAGARRTIEDLVTEKQSAAGPVAALVWKLVDPVRKDIKAPDDVSSFVEWAASLGIPKESRARARIAKRIVERAVRTWGLPVSGPGSRACRMVPKMGGGELIRSSAPTVLEDFDHEDDNSASWSGGAIEFKVPPATRSQYLALVRHLHEPIDALRTRLKLRREDARIPERGLRRGSIDEGSFHRLALHRSDPNEARKIFERNEVLSHPRIAIGLLIDESGSMDRNDGHPGENSRSAQARDVAIVVAEALRSIPGVELFVMGHTGQGDYHGGNSGDKMVLHHYYTPDNPRIEALARINGFCENLDGHAIALATKRLVEWSPDHETKVLVHISDGHPAGSKYAGEGAMNHVRGVTQKCAKEGVRVIGIGVDNAFHPSIGLAMYGPRNYCVLPEGSRVMTVVANLLTRVLLGGS